MTPEQLKNEIETLKRELSQIKEKVEKREKNQIQLPLDIASVNVVGSALRTGGYAL